MIKITLIYIMVFAVFNLLVVALFKCGMLSNTILFYRGIALIGLSSILTVGGFLILHYKTGHWRIESIIAATLISASLQLAFFVTVPVTLDRSISVFLLNRIKAHERGITKQNLTDEFVSEYVKHEDAIGRRIFEQTASKNIEASNGTIKLSRQGRCFLRAAKVIKALYGM